MSACVHAEEPETFSRAKKVQQHTQSGNSFSEVGRTIDDVKKPIVCSRLVEQLGDLLLALCMTITQARGFGG